MNEKNSTRKQGAPLSFGIEYDADNATAFDNANLISVATEMYEQCERMRNFLSPQYGEDDPFVKDADKVLSKARGE